MNTTHDCITEEDLSKPFYREKECSAKIVKNTATSQEIDVVCAGRAFQHRQDDINTPTPESMNGTMELRWRCRGRDGDQDAAQGTVARRQLQRAKRADQFAGCSAFCRRLMRLRRNTRLKRSWQEAETCSSSVELTFSTVTALAARIVAVRLAPCT